MSSDSSCPYLFSEISSGFFLNRRASFKFDVVIASITSHLHMLKLFVPSNFTTLILDWWMFMVFTADWLTSTISSRKHQYNVENQWKSRSKLDKDRTFTLKWNPRRVFKWSTLLIQNPMNKISVVLRSTHDRPSPMIFVKQITMLLGSIHDALRIDIRSQLNLRSSDTTCCDF